MSLHTENLNKDMINKHEIIKQGKKPKIKGLIEDVPEGFKQYMSEHYAQMNSWKSKPYFMMDNDIPSLIK